MHVPLPNPSPSWQSCLQLRPGVGGVGEGWWLVVVVNFSLFMCMSSLLLVREHMYTHAGVQQLAAVHMHTCTWDPALQDTCTIVGLCPWACAHVLQLAAMRVCMYMCTRPIIVLCPFYACRSRLLAGSKLRVQSWRSGSACWAHEGACSRRPPAVGKMWIIGLAGWSLLHPWELLAARMPSNNPHRLFVLKLKLRAK